MEFDPTKPVQERSGKRARIIETSARGEKPIVALVVGRDGAEFVRRVYANGRLIETAEHPCDIVNIPVKRSGWVNVYKDGLVSDIRFGNVIHPTQEGARFNRDMVNWLACIFVEIEEGEGL